MPLRQEGEIYSAGTTSQSRAGVVCHSYLDGAGQYCRSQIQDKEDGWRKTAMEVTGVTFTVWHHLLCMTTAGRLQTQHV